MKICLITVYIDEAPQEELGLCSIASYLREKEYEVLLIGSHENSIDYDRIVTFNPDVIGFTTYSETKNSIIRISKKLKKLIKDVYIVIGGYYATYYGAGFLKEVNCVDFAVVGEGEIVIHNLLKTLENTKNFSEVDGLIYKINNSIIINKKQDAIQDINILPWPARDLLEECKFRTVTISSSRGCTSSCSFCCSKDFWHKWRGRNIEDVVSEMEYINKKYGINDFFFADNSFEDPGFNIKRVRNIAQEIINRKLCITYTIFLRTGFFKKIESNDVYLLKKSGLAKVFLGIESANQEDIDLYNKNFNEKDAYNSVKFFRDNDINVRIGFINFNPYSSFDKLWKNFAYLKENKFLEALLHINRLHLLEGTSITNKIRNDGLLIESENFDNSLGYKFIDERIKELSDYLNDYYKLFSIKDGYVLASYIDDIIKRYKIIVGHKNTKALEAIIKKEEEINEIIDEMNTRCGIYYEQLLKLAEKSWDRKVADKIMETFMNKEYIDSKQKAIKICIGKLKKELYTIDPNLVVFI